MNKNYILNEQALEKLEKGSIEAVDAIKYSYGPKGRHVVIINQESNNLEIVRSGAEIIRHIELSDAFSNVSVILISEILDNLQKKTADGSKTAIILSSGLVKEAVRSIVTGINPNLLIKGMEKMVEFCVEELSHMSNNIDTEEEIRNLLKNTLQDEVIAMALSKLDLNKEIEITKSDEPVIYIESETRDKVNLKLGDINDIEYNIRIKKLEKGIELMRLNKAGGYVIGGQSAYIKIISKMQNNLHVLEIDERVGARIVLKALEIPLKQLAYSSSLEGELISQMVKMSEGDMGYDMNTNKLVDMKESGIIDFTNVIQEALMTAVSIASKIILSNAIILKEG